MPILREIPAALYAPRTADQPIVAPDESLHAPRWQPRPSGSSDLESGRAGLRRGLGLLLAGVGLYGLLVFTVGRRVRELGIRAALGAGPATVAWTAVRAAAPQVGVGVAVGLALAALVAPLPGTIFMGCGPGDALAYGAVAVILVLTGVLAAATRPAGPWRRTWGRSSGPTDQRSPHAPRPADLTDP